ncbi:uncharacterized protein LOC107780030 [Nicotiana tabacum]|uniref:Uncharacterized protein LOC107780030 n=1 Tax=Nicotiana tabacum TaxID=4097 RepID=A0A1S3YV52_TOBAC|nr:PREDICTED: uncharacterized protein LOC107780030 [Nicotiana tabacum]
MDILGRAEFVAFSQNGEWDLTKLQASLNAYELALSFNFLVNTSTVISLFLRQHLLQCIPFLGNYELTLKGFENCRWMDPPLEATNNRNTMIRLLKKLEELIKGKSKGMSKRKSGETSLPSSTSSLMDVNLKPSYKKMNLDLLSEGFNKGVAIIGKILYSVKSEKKFPLCYAIFDSDEKRFIVTLHGI